MRVFLTGAIGYIGSIIAHVLISAGISVIGLDAGIFNQDCFSRGDAFASRARMELLITKDVRDISVDDINGCDAVIDFAGLANDPTGELNPSWTDEINHRASVRLAELARETGVGRYIFASSCSVYGKQSDTMLTEEAHLSPLSQYAKAKEAAEKEILALSTSEFHPTVLRNATAFGASPRMRLDLVINNLTASGYATGKIKVLSDGTSWRPNVHVEDIAGAVLACLQTDIAVTSGQIFNVGMTSENYQVRELAKIVSELLHCDIEFAKNAAKDTRSYRVSFEKISKHLTSFRPKWTARMGIMELKEAFDRNCFDSKKFRLHAYYNIDTIKDRLESGEFDETLRLKR